MSSLQLISLRGQMRISVSSGQRRRVLDGLRLDPGDQRAERLLDVTRRALADPSPRRAAYGDAKVPEVIKIGHIKAGPREAGLNGRAWEGSLEERLTIVGPSIAFKRRFDAPAAAGCAQPAEGEGVLR